ncbi:Uncharacterized protein YphG, TPR-domain containing [Klebsiella pneumoniae ISC21]|nr:Uncharacterized protein YphG, TPR-domain containing [Klebsiella pneumoniae ISC21]
MQQLLQINPAHDKAHLIRHALQSGIFFLNLNGRARPA